MRSFLAGIIVSSLLLITSIFLNNSSMIMFLLLLLGVVPLIISGLLSGTFLSGDRIRANYSEPKEFSERSRIGSMFFLFGIPCVLAGIAINYF